MTILPKGAKAVTEYKELAYLFMRLLRENVQVAIISGNSFEEQAARIFEAVKAQMQDGLSPLKNLTFYVNGGATKYVFDKEGNKAPDIGYNEKHAMELGDLRKAVEDSIREMINRDFDLSLKQKEEFIRASQAKAEGLELRLPWGKAGAAWHLFWILKPSLNALTALKFSTDTQPCNL